MDIAERLVHHARCQIARACGRDFFEFDVHIDVARKPQRCRIGELHLAVSNSRRLFRQPYLRLWCQQIRSQLPDVETRFIHPSDALAQEAKIASVSTSHNRHVCASEGSCEKATTYVSWPPIF
jgi:hypothetical protein